MAQMMQAAQSAAKMNAMQMQAMSALSSFDMNDPFAACTGKQEDDEEEEEPEDDANAIKAPDEQVAKYTLRMCIHSASQMPKYMSYIIVEIQAEDGSVQTHQSEECTESQTPVWEFNFEQEIEVGSTAPNVELQVWGKRFLGNRLLGACKIPFKKANSSAAWSTAGPLRKTLRVKGSGGASMMGGKPLHPKVLCVWQLANSRESMPDLNRIAEMNMDSMDPKKWCVDVKVCRVIMKKPSDKPQRVSAKVELIHNAKAPSHFDSTKHVLTAPKDESLAAPGGSTKAKSAKIQYQEAKFGNDEGDDSGYQVPLWILQNTSHVQLLSYTLKAVVMLHDDAPAANTSGEIKDGAEPEGRVIGSYEEEINGFMDSIEETGQKLWFNAEIRSKTGIPMANLLLECDVYSDGPHKSQRDTVMKKLHDKNHKLSHSGSMPIQAPKIAMRLGMASVREGNRNQSHYVTVYADSIPVMGDMNLNPYVKIIMGSSASGRAETPKNVSGQHYDIKFLDTLKIQCKGSDKKCKVELWNKKSSLSLFGGNDELLGETEIYDVVPNVTYWKHWFGGALAEPRKADEAMQMTRGAIKPASTYHGSVSVHFGTRPKVPNAHFEKLKHEREKVSLIVRLYRGLYMDGFIDAKEVSVLIQLPGAKLEVEPGSLASALPDNERDLHAFNPNVLAFPGTVDANGVLRFRPEEYLDPRTGNGHKEGKKVAWVERTTPLATPLMMLPGTSHAYCYIVPLGDEDQPPKVFGRIRVQKSFDPDVKPAWKRLRYDQSVMDLPPSHFKDDLAGFLLGTAVLVQHTAEMAPAHAPKAAPASSDKLDGQEAPVEGGVEGGVEKPHQMQYLLNDGMVDGMTTEDDLTLGGIILTLDENQSSAKTPKAAKPSSVLCKPCVGETSVLIGSLGEKVRYRFEFDENSENTARKRTVYAHIDMMAARSLQAMDEDGLADPCYGVRIEDKRMQNTSKKEFGKTLDPVFMHRLVVPVEVECIVDDTGTVMKECDLPLPPIIIQIFDRDQNNMMYAELEKMAALMGPDSMLSGIVDKGADKLSELSQMGKVMVKKPRLLPMDDDDQREGCIALNNVHEAYWYALDASATTPFNGETGGVPEGWRTRSRVLVAAGFSAVKNPRYYKDFPQLQDNYGKDGNGNEEWYHEDAPWPEDANGKGFEEGDNGRAFKFHLCDIDSNELDDSQYCYVMKIDCSATASYQIEIDLLGIRNLGTPGSMVSMPSLDLLINSFWEGPQVKIESAVFSGDPRNPNFTAEYEAEDWQKFQTKVKTTMKISADDDALKPLWKDRPKTAMAAGFGAGFAALGNLAGSLGDLADAMGDLAGIGDSSDEEDEGAVPLDQFMGWRLIAPVYTAPVIPYLQKLPPFDKLPKGPPKAGQEPYVMLPDLVLHLRNQLTGNDMGTYSAKLPIIGNTVKEQDKETWPMMSLNAIGKMAEKDHPNHDLSKLKTLPNVTVIEDAYEIFVDVFASDSGYLTWNSKTRMGRGLQHQELFRMAADDPDDKDDDDDSDSDDDDDANKPKQWSQYFNAADWTISDPKFSVEPFDHRFSPCLRVGEFDPETGKWDEEARKKEVPRRIINSMDTKNYNLHAEPIQPRTEMSGLGKEIEGRQGLFPSNFTVPNPSQVKAKLTKDKAKIAEASKQEADCFQKASTAQLSKAGSDHGYRCVTHLAAPEVVDRLKHPRVAEDYLKANEHTFIREVGHRINEKDRDSRILARLRVSPAIPQGLQDYLNGLHGPGNKFAKDVKNDRGFPLKEEGGQFYCGRSSEMQVAKTRSGNGDGTCGAVAGQCAACERYQAKEGHKTPEEVDHYIENNIVKYQAYLESSKNYMHIKFRRGGTVVWAAPKERVSFADPGEIMFAVKLTDGDVVVAVAVPVFDLRFQRETTWYVRKTCVQRFKTLENRINLKKEAAERKKNKGGKDKPPTLTDDEDIEKGEGAPKEEVSDKKVKGPKEEEGAITRKGFETDGYSRPIKITKNAFCLRIHKRIGTHHFDRPRTSNWYRKVLQDVFPEVKVMPIHPSDDFGNIRNYFFSRFMNLRTCLCTGESMEEAGLVKGHISMHRLTDEEIQDKQKKVDEEIKAEEEKKANAIGIPGAGAMVGFLGKAAGVHVAEEIPDYRLPKCGIRPIENMWIKSDVLVNIYVLTARNLKADTGGAAESATVSMCPYIVVDLAGDPLSRQQSAIIEDMPRGANAVDFYKHFAMTPALPGASTLRIQVYNSKGVLGALSGGDTLLGMVEVDLEDRNFVLTQRNMRAQSSVDFLQRNKSPAEVKMIMKAKKEETKENWPSTLTSRPSLQPSAEILESKDLKDTTCLKLTPHLSPMQNLPIEAKEIISEDEETGTKVPVGSLRYWVDICPVEQAYMPAKLEAEGRKFEIRVTVWGITGISIFQDLGERNDVYVEGRLRSMGPKGEVVEKKEKTDVHKWAHDEANFNFMMVYEIQAPAQYCTIDFGMFDEDKMSENDPIYEPKELPLDHMLMLAFNNAIEGREPLGIDQTKIVFDSWPKKKKKESHDANKKGGKPGCCRRVLRCICCCCRGSATAKPPKPATMNISVQVIPMEEALLNKVQSGRLGTEDPKGRMNWKTAITEPGRFLKAALGPKCVKCIIWVVILLLVFLVCLVILYVSYLVLQNVSAVR